MIQEDQNNYIDIDHFFKMSLGSWMNQTTSYDTSSKKHKTSTARTYIDQVSDKVGVRYFELQSEAKNPFYTISSKKGKKEANSIITYSKKGSVGTIYKINKKSNKIVFKGKFHISSGILKIVTKKKSTTIEETVWFINDNLKLTKSITKKNDHCILISFASEIKIKSN
nr:Ycf58 [Erythrotrichia welwitschii]